MKKKIILIFCMLALFACVFAISISADELILVGNTNNPDLAGTYANSVIYTDDSGSEYTFNIIELSSSAMNSSAYYINPFEFQKWCKDVSGKDNLSYDEFKTYLSNSREDGIGGFVSYWTSDYAGFNEEYFNKLMNYKTVTEEDLNAKYNEGFEDGKESGFSEGYAEGMNDFAQEEKDLIEGHYSHGGEFTYSSLDSYISSNGSSEFLSAYVSVGVSSNYLLFEEQFSSSSSHGGSSVTVTQQGSNYGASHQGAIDTGCCYNPGYIDGVADGGDIYKGSESYQADIENEINTYMQSEEYTTLMNEYSTEVINNYLKSTEYEASIDSSFIAGALSGEANAYEKAKEEVYGQGVRDGQLNYRNSQEFIDAIDSSYGEGYYKGSEDGKNSVVDPTGVIVLIVIVALLGVVFFIIAKKSSKKKR